MSPLMAKVEAGHALVGVHTDDADRAERADRVLTGLDPAETARLDADESFRPPGDVAAIAGRDVPSGQPDSPGGDHEQADWDPERRGGATGGTARDHG